MHHSVHYCSPVIVMALTPLVFRERLTAPKLVGFAVVLAGVVLVNGNVAGELNAWGVLCGAMSAVAFAFMALAAFVGVRQGF